MTLQKKHLYIVAYVLVAGAIAIAIYLIYIRKKKENFTGFTAGALDNTGVFLNQAYDSCGGGANIPTENFADLVQGEDYTSQYIKKKAPSEKVSPMERLSRIQGEALMPRVSTDVTPFNIDVANPSSHKFMVNTPRVVMKSRYKGSDLTSMIRGDIPIRYFPDVPLISKTHQGRDDLRLDGYFTPHYDALYDKYTGSAYNSYPMYIAGAGQAGGYGGASGEIIMDY